MRKNVYGINRSVLTLEKFKSNFFSKKYERASKNFPPTFVYLRFKL